MSAKYRLRLCIVLGQLLYGCSAVANQEVIDCSLPHVDTRIDQCLVVRNASEFPAGLRVEDVDGHACILMDADLRFQRDQGAIPITAVFDRSGATLDCAGGSIDFGRGRHGARDLPGGVVTPAGTGSLPFVRFVDDTSLSDITVRNCNMRGTRGVGMQLTRFFGGELGGDGRLSPDEALPVGHHRILLEDLVIEDVGVGIYLGNYSEDITMNRVHIDGTERIAIYSESGSHRVTLTDSVIANNRTREAVALDSTYNSEISNTLFLNNREGAVNVYRNCGELKGVVCPVVRSTAPNNNRIFSNSFVNNGVGGVRIASRQGRNHSTGWCADLNGEAGKFADTSQDNVVEDNVFVCDEGTSLVMQDGPNLVRNNHIVARERCVPYEISTGGFNRSASQELDGLVLEGNTLNSVRPPKLRNLGTGVRVSE